MARDLLSNLDSWDLVYDEQDVRGRDVYDADGTKIGTVRDLVADTDAARVVALVLHDGRQLDADLIEIGSERVVVHNAAVPASTAAAVPAAEASRRFNNYEGDHLRPRVVAADTYAAGTVSGAEASFGTRTGDVPHTAARDAGLGETPHTPSGTDAGAYAGMAGMMGSTSNPLGSATADDFSAQDDLYFRDYHRNTYGGADFETAAPAYRAGALYGRRADWHGRAWDAVEPDVRRDYSTHHGEDAWERFKDHVRSGFQRARNAVTGGDDGHRSTPQ